MFAAVLAGFFVGVAVEAAGGVRGEAFVDVEVNAVDDAADGFFLAFAGGRCAGGDGAGRDVGAGEGLDDAGSELGHGWWYRRGGPRVFRVWVEIGRLARRSVGVAVWDWQCGGY